MDSGIKRACRVRGYSSTHSRNHSFKKKDVHMVQSGAKKLKIKAKPFGQSYTAVPRSASSATRIKRGRPIREVSEGIACTVLELPWSRSGERDNDSKTEPGRRRH